MAFVNFSSFEFATLTDLTYGIMMNVNPVYSHLPGAMTNVFNNVARRYLLTPLLKIDLFKMSICNINC